MTKDNNLKHIYNICHDIPWGKDTLIEKIIDRLSKSKSKIGIDFIELDISIELDQIISIEISFKIKNNVYGKVVRNYTLFEYGDNLYDSKVGITEIHRINKFYGKNNSNNTDKVLPSVLKRSFNKIVKFITDSLDKFFNAKD